MITLECFAFANILYDTQDFAKNTLPLIQAIALVVGGFWVYFKFRREDPHKPRIQFDIQTTFLGEQRDSRVVSVEILAINKGLVDHQFASILLRIRGIDDTALLTRRKEDGKSLDFPNRLLEETELVIPEPGKEPDYFFVRPGVTQSFTFTTTIPRTSSFILVHAAFKYQKSADRHTSERAFKVD